VGDAVGDGGDDRRGEHGQRVDGGHPPAPHPGREHLRRVGVHDRELAPDAQSADEHEDRDEDGGVHEPGDDHADAEDQQVIEEDGLAAEPVGHQPGEDAAEELAAEERDRHRPRAHHGGEVQDLRDQGEDDPVSEQHQRLDELAGGDHG
jgi:hypothetical protein